MEGSLEAEPSRYTPFVSDPRGFLEFGSARSLNGTLIEGE